jgi:hypothetical protein
MTSASDALGPLVPGASLFELVESGVDFPTPSQDLISYQIFRNLKMALLLHSKGGEGVLK